MTVTTTATITLDRAALVPPVPVPDLTIELCYWCGRPGCQWCPANCCPDPGNQHCHCPSCTADVGVQA